MSSWTGLATAAFRAAANSLTAIPPPDHNLPTLRDVDGADTSTTTPQQRMESPQKFGVWLVSGLGVVVAFRGTANEHDMMVNLELEPEPIHVGDAVDERVQLHRGFYCGCLDHVGDILDIVHATCAAVGVESKPLWLTGHSLGGAYASALTIHLLVNHALYGALFAGGGGLTTFGSPMILYSKQPTQLWQSLHALTVDHPHMTSLTFDYVVNLGDMVPRLLGSNFESLHASLRNQLSSWLPQLINTQDLALHYHPLGWYRAIANGQVRHPPREESGNNPTNTTTNTTPTNTTTTTTTTTTTVLGSTARSAAVVRMMDLSSSLPVIMAQRAVVGGAVPSYHSMHTYLQDIETCMKDVAAGVYGAHDADEAGTLSDLTQLFGRNGGGRDVGVASTTQPQESTAQRLASEAVALMQQKKGLVKGVGALLGWGGGGQQGGAQC